MLHSWIHYIGPAGMLKDISYVAIPYPPKFSPRDFSLKIFGAQIKNKKGRGNV